MSDGAEDGGLPTQRIIFSVDERLWGEVPDSFELFKTGSDEAWIEGDPPYREGETYLLFLEQRVNGDGSVEPRTFVPIAPDGRLKVVQSKVERVIPGFVSEKLHGAPVRDVESAAQAERRGG